MQSVPYMINAVVIAIRKPHDWMISHQDMMIRCFLLSIQGAGPIRSIAHIQHWTGGYGPIPCQNRRGGLATNCMWEYVFRLLLINLWTTYTSGMYCKMRGSKQVTQAFLANLRNTFVITLSLLALSHLPHNEWMLA